MIKSFFKNEKGINLISLSVAVIVLFILTGIILYNITGNLGIQRLQAMQSDIQNLREKVEIYYSKYEKLPIDTNTKYDKNSTAITNLKNAGILNSSDNDEMFYILELSELDNVTLNYGEDYKKIKNDGGDKNDLLDVYIINENSHNIFYVEGITVDKETYYTDYTNENISEDENITLLTIDDINRVSNAKGSERVYKKNTELEDDYGNKVIVPAGFKVAEDSDDNVTGGVVIEDAKYEKTVGSQFVWIPVGTVYTNEDKTESKTIALGRYVFDSNGNIDTSLSKTEPQDQLKISSSDTYYFTEGLKDETTTNTHAKNIEEFINSANHNGGYYIGRYEARTAKARATETDALTQITEKPEENVYNYVTQPQAAELSRNMYTSKEFTSDLINSYAWDTAILFLQEFDNRTVEVQRNTNYKGNYSRQIRLSSSFANKGTNNLAEASNIDKICNIYDMAGNTREWSTEADSLASVPCVYRGGYYDYGGSYAAGRYSSSTTFGNAYHSFRPLLYL